MVIKYRDDLTKLFNNSVVPEAKSFGTLINSTLVKRDDQFYGKWKPGVGYAEGDVVLHNNTFYYFVKKGNKTEGKEIKDCNCDDCGNTAPNLDSCCWQQVRFDLNDHDWEFIEDNNKKKTGLYAAVTGKVGIGTGQDADAFFHINDDKKGGGQLLFNPLHREGKRLPMLKMLNLSMHPKPEDGVNPPPEPAFVAQSLDEKKVIFLTDTEGYLFRQANSVPRSVENREKEDDDAHEKHGHTEGGHPDASLMFVSSNHQKPRVGIGTEAPQATLDLSLAGHGQIRADAGEDNAPDITLVNKSSLNETYLSETISTQQAALVTNAPDGFMFKTDRSHAERFGKQGRQRTDSGTPMMVVQPDEIMQVKVGIGTTDPQTQLEVDGKEGKIQMSLHDNNPSLNVINKTFRNGESADGNFLAIGSTNEQQAVFATNSQNGFVFKHTHQQGGNVPNVSRGTKFLFLKREKTNRDAFSMTMDGRIAAKGFYAAAAPDDASQLANHKALQHIRGLKPTYYHAPNDDERQFGFLSAEMPNGLEGLVKDFDGLGKEDKAIAYHSIVALLVGAVKDLSDTVHELKGRIKDLENQAGA